MSRTPGWRVEDNLPFTISTAYRWITTAIQTLFPGYTPDPFALFPIVVRPAWVFQYSIRQDGSALLQESEERIVSGDYAMYAQGMEHHIWDQCHC